MTFLTLTLGFEYSFFLFFFRIPREKIISETKFHPIRRIYGYLTKYCLAGNLNKEIKLKKYISTLFSFNNINENKYQKMNS